MFHTDYELADVRDTLPVSSNDRITLPCPASDTLPAPKRTISEKRRLANHIKKLRRQVKQARQLVKMQKQAIQLAFELDDLFFLLGLDLPV
jgi:predicted secreted protein